jgi:hypothetical protein
MPLRRFATSPSEVVSAFGSPVPDRIAGDADPNPLPRISMRPAVTKAVTEGSLLSKLADAQEPFWVAVSDAIATVAADQIQRTPDYPSIVTSGGSDLPCRAIPHSASRRTPPTEKARS